MRSFDEPLVFPPDAMAARAALLRRTLWAAPFLLLALAMMVPWAPICSGTADLDSSYVIAYHYAFINGFRLGVDMIGTYGPWGFTGSHYYYPETFGWVVVVRSFFAFSLFAGLWKMGELLRVHPAARGVWIVAIAFVGSLFFDDGLMSAMCLLPALIRRADAGDDRRDPWQVRLLVVSLALASLSKFTYLVAGGAAIAALSTEDVVRRRVPWLGALYVVSLLAFWRIAGQPMGTFPYWVYNALNVAGGYSAAMGHPADDFYMVPLVVALSGTIAIAVAAVFWKRDHIGAGVVGITASFVLFMCYKEAFVRHDGGHEAAATTGVLSVALMVLPALWRTDGRARLPFRAIGLAVVAVSVFGLTRTYARFYPSRALSRDIAALPVRCAQRLANAAVWSWRGADLWRDEYAAGMARIRGAYPFPNLRGSVDMYGVSQLAVFAHGFDYEPRPITPGYHAWTPHLIGLNAASLAGPRAPDHALFALEPIDNHYPSLDDGPLWPHLLSRYNLADLASDRWLVLDRAPQPRPIVFTPLPSGTYHFGEEIPVPDPGSGAVWVQIHTAPNTLGRLRNLLYRAPEVDLIAKMADGTQVRHRIVPAVAEAGFVLSPYVSDVGVFASLLTQRRFPHDVTSISIALAPGASPATWCQSDIQVTFKRLVIESQDLSHLPALETRANLAYMSRTNTSIVVSMSFFSAPDGTTALFAHAPLSLQLPLPTDGRRRLHFGYGIREGVWNDSRGVTFRVSAVGPDGVPRPLWTATLDPRNRLADRRHFTADVDVPPGPVDHILFETVPVEWVPYAWSYWSDVHFAVAPVKTGAARAP